MKYLLTFVFALVSSILTAQTPDSTSFTVTKDSVTKVLITQKVIKGGTQVITLSEMSGTDSVLMRSYVNTLVQSQVSKSNDIAIVSQYRKELTSALKSLKDFETKLKFQSDTLFPKHREITKNSFSLKKDGNEWKTVRFKINNEGKILLISESKSYKCDYLYRVIRLYDFSENLEILDLYLIENYYISPCGRFVLKPIKN